MDDFEIEEELKIRATNQLPDVPAVTPEELPDKMAVQLLWEISMDAGDFNWSRRHADRNVEVFRSDVIMEARLNKAEWTFDRKSIRRWIPTGGSVTVTLRDVTGMPDTAIRTCTSRFTGPISREGFVEHVCELLLDLKQRYVIGELDKLR